VSVVGVDDRLAREEAYLVTQIAGGDLGATRGGVRSS
jgi:hypothetical protein